MKKTTIAAIVFAAAVLAALYFYKSYKNNKIEISVAGINCETVPAEVYLLLINPSGKDVLCNAGLTFINTNTKEKVKAEYPISSVLKAHEYRQDTVFINSSSLSSFNCTDYHIEAAVRRQKKTF